MFANRKKRLFDYPFIVNKPFTTELNDILRHLMKYKMSMKVIFLKCDTSFHCLLSITLQYFIHMLIKLVNI